MVAQCDTAAEVTRVIESWPDRVIGRWSVVEGNTNKCVDGICFIIIAFSHKLARYRIAYLDSAALSSVASMLLNNNISAASTHIIFVNQYSRSFELL
jgi:hypothetical protein